MDLPDQPRPAAALHREGAEPHRARDRRTNRHHGARRPPHRRGARDVGIPLPRAQRPAQPLRDQAAPAAAGPRRARAAGRRPPRRLRRTGSHQREGKRMSAPDRQEQLRAEVAYRRLDLYRAKVYGPRSTSAARLSELEREYELAAARLTRATATAPVVA